MKHLAQCLLFLIAGCLTARTQVPTNPKTEAAKELEVADEAYYKDLETARRNYRVAFSKVITKASAIEVYLLDFETTSAKGAETDRNWFSKMLYDQFPIIPNGSCSKILKRKRLRPEEFKLILPNLQTIMAAEKNPGGLFCHFPIHGIRIWSGYNVIFESSFCYHCSNFYITYPGGGSGYINSSLKEFQKVMEQLMPIPQAAKDRFKKSQEDANK